MNLDPNKELKKYARSKKIPMWQIAEKFGINENKLGSMLHEKLSIEEEKAFKTAVDYIAERSV